MTLDQAIERSVLLVRKRAWSSPYDRLEIFRDHLGSFRSEAILSGVGQVYVKGRSLEDDWEEWTPAWAREEERRRKSLPADGGAS